MKISSRGGLEQCELYLHLMHAVVVDWEPPGLDGYIHSSTQQRSRRTASGEGMAGRVKEFLEDARKLVPRVPDVRVRLAV